MSGFLFESLKKTVLNVRKKTALIFEKDSYTFDELYAETIKCIKYLSSLKLRKGDIIFNALGTSIENVVLTYAANFLGIIVTHISTQIKESHFHIRLLKITPKVIFYNQEKLSFIDSLDSNKYLCINDNELKYLCSKQTNNLSITSNINGEDPAILLFTSGTSSSPKCAVITNKNIEAAVIAYQDALCLKECDNTILAVPLYHITGLIAILALFIYLGGTTYCEEHFDAAKTFKLIRKHNISFFHGSPTIFTLLSQYVRGYEDQEQPYTSITSIACGAGRLNKGTIKILKKLFPKANIHTVYGLTESTSPLTIYRNDISTTQFCSSSGSLVKGAHLKIIDEQTGKALAKKQIGQIWISGEMVIKSYYPITNENKRLFKDGYLNTGDLGFINDDNDLIVKDRAKDIINRGGEKIFCPEIENLISLDKNILEVAVVAKQDAIYGQIPVAFIRLQNLDTFNSKAINESILKNLPKICVPVEYYIINEFPRTENGKINKKDLRAKLKD